MSGSAPGPVARRDKTTSKITKRPPRSKTPLPLPAPRKPLLLTWEKKILPVDEKETTQLILRPKSTLQKYLPQAETAWTDTSKVKLVEFFDAYQEAMKKYVDWQIASASGTIQMVKEEGQVQDAILRNAIETLDYNFRRSQEQVQNLLLERDTLTAPEDPMDLDLPEPHLPDFIYQIQDAISKGQLTILPPVEEKGVRPRADSALTEEQFPVQIRPPPPVQQQQESAFRNPEDLTPVGLEPGGSSTPLPPPHRREYGRTFGLGLGGYDPWQPDSPTPRQQAGGSGIGRGFPFPVMRPPPPPEEERRARSEPTPGPREDEEEGQEGGAGAGGGGATGGGGAGGEGRVAGGGGGDPEGSDDSEPEGDDRRAWQRYTRRMLRKQERRMMAMVSAMMSGASSDPTAGRA